MFVPMSRTKRDQKRALGDAGRQAEDALGIEDHGVTGRPSGVKVRCDRLDPDLSLRKARHFFQSPFPAAATRQMQRKAVAGWSVAYQHSIHVWVIRMRL